jgi:dihydroorotase/N-acyl-D-amino-acid deacylase
MLQRLNDPALRERIKKEMDDPTVREWENQWYGAGGAAGVMLSAAVEPSLKQYEGMNFEQIGAAMKKDPRDAVMDLVVADKARSDVITTIMTEADVRAALADPLVAIGTDSSARAKDGPLAGSKSHPRGWGSFARILGRYVRDERLLPLEEAIRRFTSRAAWRVGIKDRGMLREGMKADVTVFNPETIHDTATYDEPTQYAEGIAYVMVNGQLVVDSGRMTEARPGQVIRGPGYRKQ